MFYLELEWWIYFYYLALEIALAFGKDERCLDAADIEVLGFIIGICGLELTWR